MPCSHWSPISLVPHYSPFYPVLIGPPSHWSPNVTLYALFSLVPHLVALDPCLIYVRRRNGGRQRNQPTPSRYPIVTLCTLFSLVPHLIGPPMLPFLPCSHWSPISLVPQCNPGYTVLIGPPSHWSPSLTPSTLLFSLVPHLIAPPPPPRNLSYPALIGPPSYWSPNVTLVIQFSLVPHLIAPPPPPPPPVTFPSLLSLVSLVPQCNPGYTVLIGSPSHWFPSLTPSTLFSLVPHLIGPPMRPWLHSSHWSPISLVPQCDHDYTVLIGPPSHWSPNATMITQFSLVPHLIGPPMRPWLHSSHWSPISLVPQSNPVYPFLIGSPSLIGPPM